MLKILFALYFLFFPSLLLAQDRSPTIFYTYEEAVFGHRLGKHPETRLFCYGWDAVGDYRVLYSRIIYDDDEARYPKIDIIEDQIILTWFDKHGSVWVKTEERQPSGSFGYMRTCGIYRHVTVKRLEHVFLDCSERIRLAGTPWEEKVTPKVIWPKGVYGFPMPTIPEEFFEGIPRNPYEDVFE